MIANDLIVNALRCKHQAFVSDNHAGRGIPKENILELITAAGGKLATSNHCGRLAVPSVYRLLELSHDYLLTRAERFVPIITIHNQAHVPESRLLQDVMCNWVLDSVRTVGLSAAQS